MTAAPDTSPKSMIYDLVRDPARDAIQQRVNTEVNNVAGGIVDKNGDGKQDENASWWERLQAFFMMLIFNIAKIFGAEKWLAGAFGMPIPEKKEVDALSHQVAASIDHSLSKEKFEYKNRDEFKVELHNRLLGDLHAERAKYPSFSNAHLQETAEQTVNAIMARPQFASAFNADGTRNNTIQAPLTQIVAANSFYTEFNKALTPDLKESLKPLTKNGSFGRHEIAMVSNALAPALVELETTKPTKDEAGFTNVAGKFRAALAANHNVAWVSDGARDLFADRVAATYMQTQHDTAMPTTFQQRIDDQQKALAAVLGQPAIKAQVAEGIRSEVVIGTMKSYDESLLTRPYYRSIAADVEKIKRFHTAHKEWGYVVTPNLSETDKAELTQLQNKIYDFAQKNGYAPNTEQRDRISDVVSTRVVKVLGETKETERGRLSSLMESDIKKALEENHQSINTLGTTKDKLWGNGYTIDAVNNNIKPRSPIYEQIGRDFSRVMRENNDAWKQLEKLHDNLQGAPAKVDSKTTAVDLQIHKAASQRFQSSDVPKETLEGSFPSQQQGPRTAEDFSRLV